MSIQLEFPQLYRVVEFRIAVAPRLIRAGVTIQIRRILDYPDELLHRVIQRQNDPVERGIHCLIARELELLDEVFVRNLREAATLLRIQEDIVNPERGGD
jgi:hypothetical protein